MLLIRCLFYCYIIVSREYSISIYINRIVSKYIYNVVSKEIEMSPKKMGPVYTPFMHSSLLFPASYIQKGRR